MITRFMSLLQQRFNNYSVYPNGSQCVTVYAPYVMHKSHDMGKYLLSRHRSNLLLSSFVIFNLT